MNKSELPVIVCCSGGLGICILERLVRLNNIRIIGALSDKKSYDAVRSVVKENVPVFVGNPRGTNAGTVFGRCSLLISANYLFILPKEIFELADLAINIHGSMLPKYMGRTPNTWTIINDECETGVTVHQIEDDVDTGDIIYQESIPILNRDTAGTLTEKMMARYPIIIEKVVRDYCCGKITKRKQDLEKKTFFGKRTPEDGLINWNWSARKVYNWVRAQTKPYPGAYYFHEEKKYRVWWVEEEYRNLLPSAPYGLSFVVEDVLYIKCGTGYVRMVDRELCI